jgi:crotonobetainyl-CoA:carnitine CoA-transferase CaiB-like acyl-CoA transferase
MPGVTLPLEGLRVLEYAQYVAGPFAGMLLADLGADLIKVESPAGDAWRRYEPNEKGASRAFYARNRNKRSVVIDLQTEAGLRASRALLAEADAVLHNFPPARAARYGLDRETVRAVNPQAARCMVSALGSDGPDAGLTAFDLVAQALSGLLLADARPGDEVPRRAGGIAIADFTAGMLAAVSILAGLVGRRDGSAPGVEVSLLGAALAVQAQRFVSVDARDLTAERAAQRIVSVDARTAERAVAGPRDLVAVGARVRAAEELEPYYRAYRAADGFFVLTCLNVAQRRTTLRLLGLEDPFIGDPQAEPASEPERAGRALLVRRFEAAFASEPAQHWIRLLREAGVPAGPVRTLDHVYDDPQTLANGLVQDVAAPAATRCGCSEGCSRSRAMRPARAGACRRWGSTPPRCSGRLGCGRDRRGRHVRRVGGDRGGPRAGRAGAVAPGRGPGRPLPRPGRRARGDRLARAGA